jgi:hypothetical protein
MQPGSDAVEGEPVVPVKVGETLEESGGYTTSAAAVSDGETRRGASRPPAQQQMGKTDQPALGGRVESGRPGRALEVLGLLVPATT